MIGLLLPVFVSFEVVGDAGSTVKLLSLGSWLNGVAAELGMPRREVSCMLRSNWELITAHSKCECARAFGGFEEGEGHSLGEGLLPVDFALPAGDIYTGDGEIRHFKVPLRNKKTFMLSRGI
jgi:hypothetical protein